MRSRNPMALAVLLTVAVFAGCKSSAPQAPHVSLTSLEPLRNAFNADSGKVRAIFLASPT